jgi:hypothetical protein
MKLSVQIRRQLNKKLYFVILKWVHIYKVITRIYFFQNKASNEIQIDNDRVD